MAQLDELIEESKNKKGGVVIFKHSTRCAISNAAFSRLQRNWNIPEDVLPVYYLDLLRFRDISNAVAERFGVPHESPQLILIKDGGVVYTASHFGIDAKEVEEQAYV